jgi:hypothetical protein
MIRVFSWAISSVGVLTHHLGKHFHVEFFGHGKKFGKMVDFGSKLILVISLENFIVTENFI